VHSPPYYLCLQTRTIARAIALSGCAGMRSHVQSPLYGCVQVVHVHLAVADIL